MTRFDEDVLEIVMERTRAWELLNDPNYSSRLTMGDFYSLLLRAGYPAEEARKAANQHGWDRLSAGEMM